MLEHKQSSIDRDERPMPTHTAPLFGDDPTSRVVTIRFIDVSGDKGAEDLEVPFDAATADIEAYIAAYAALTNATIYETLDTLKHSGAMLVSNATSAFRASVESGINIGFREFDTGNYFVTRVVAPVAATMSGSTDTPLAAALDTLCDAIEVLRAGFARATAQYTGRRERKNNTKTPL